MEKCTGQVPAQWFMCPRCWQLASPTARQLVNGAFRDWCRGKAEEEGFLQALAFAIRSTRYGIKWKSRRHPTIGLRHKVAESQSRAS